MKEIDFRAGTSPFPVDNSPVRFGEVRHWQWREGDYLLSAYGYLVPTDSGVRLITVPDTSALGQWAVC